MFDELKKHHIGIIVSDEQRKKIEKRLKRKFNMDKTQGTRVLFEKDPYLGFYKEYIVKEGRVKYIPLGFAHICYDVKNQSELNKIENFIDQNELGLQITKLEKSGAEECGWVKFYFIKNHGVIELNLLKKDV
jgi:hypothetical protein|tara:strand:+ start:219 stop:614 length:396 start_codon:yes stop_codon:yes gene_type:complete